MGKYYRPNPSFERELLTSPEVGTAVQTVTDEIVDEMSQRAPFSRIADRITATVTLDHERGWRGQADSNDFISHFWEYGTINHDARPFVRPALDAVEMRHRRS